MTAPQLMFRDAGASPHDLADILGECSLCGATEVLTALAKKALKTGFSEYSLAAAPWSDRVCAACMWTLSGVPPHTYRMWSTVFREDRSRAASHPEKAPPVGAHTTLTNRGNTRPIIDALLDPPKLGPWFVAVAESGQKHILVHTPVNGPGERYSVRFEAVTITTSRDLFAETWTAVTNLRRSGFSASDIKEGRPSPARLTEESMPVWRDHADWIATHHADPLTELGLYLATKEVIENG